MIPQGISLISPPSVPEYPKKIHWIWTTGGVDTPYFPKQGRERAIKENSWNPQPLQPFLDSIAEAKISRMILDPHFDEKVGIWSIWDYIQLNPDVETKIIVGKKDLCDELSNWKQSRREIAECVFR